jgi:hypothetical protein
MSRTATALSLVEPRSSACRCSARGVAPDHHDRLLAMLDDPEELLSFFELAVTWGELDYSGERLIPPASWGEFVTGHQWSDPDRAARTFSLAADMALASSRR